MNYRLGEMRKGKEIGKRGGLATSYFVWSKCVDCPKERWVICFRGEPRNLRCKVCGGKYAIKKIKKRFGADNPAWKGGKVWLSDYIGIRRPNHPRSNNGYVLEHIWSKPQPKR